jgi:biotin transporter BioY
MRGALATLLFSIGWIIVLSLSGVGMIYSYPQNIWIPVSWIAVTFVIGWIYEKRKTRNFVLSWGILTLEAAILLLMVAGSLNSKTQISDVVGGLVVTIIVSSFIGVITAAIEALIQAIVVFIHKKKQQV